MLIDEEEIRARYDELVGAWPEYNDPMLHSSAELADVTCIITTLAWVLGEVTPDNDYALLAAIDESMAFTHRENPTLLAKWRIQNEIFKGDDNLLIMGFQFGSPDKVLIVGPGTTEAWNERLKLPDALPDGYKLEVVEHPTVPADNAFFLNREDYEKARDAAKEMGGA